MLKVFSVVFSLINYEFISEVLSYVFLGTVCYFDLKQLNNILGASQT